METTLDPAVEENISLFLEGCEGLPALREEVEALRRNSPEGLIDAFYTTLSFGTGGLRGIMGAGTNRMNVLTVRMATQGVAEVALRYSQQAKVAPRAFIGYDSRHHSREFAEETAKVFAGNGIEVFLCEELRPTPFVSFGCRQLGCCCAIMITASHNPPQYNGYKVYWSDGAQVVPPIDAELIAAIREQRGSAVRTAKTLKDPLIRWVGRELDEAYLSAMEELATDPIVNHAHGKELKIIYTPLHGTGGTLAPALLKRWGFTDVIEVAAQKAPNGDFPTVASPNPEEPKALALGIAEMKETKSDLLLATDPDADRVAAAVFHKGNIELLSGNQTACLCLEHLCAMREKKGCHHPLLSQERLAAVKTIVTTELFAEICRHYNINCFDVLPGFKYIAEEIRSWEEELPLSETFHFLFGGEESFGCLLGSKVRDKDGITTAALIAEVALHAKLRGETLVDMKWRLFAQYGLFVDLLTTVSFPETREGRIAMSAAMNRLRAAPPKSIEDSLVVSIDDHLSGERLLPTSGERTAISLPKTDAVVLRLEDQTKLVVRPSGTEPKVKLYGNARARYSGEPIAAEAALKKQLQNHLTSLKGILQRDE